MAFEVMEMIKYFLPGIIFTCELVVHVYVFFIDVSINITNDLLWASDAEHKRGSRQPKRGREQ